MLKKIIIIIGALGVAIGLTLTNQAPEAVYKLFPGYFPDSDKAWEDSSSYTRQNHRIQTTSIRRAGSNPESN